MLFFDGVCKLCSGSVQWILKRDTEGQFHFAPLQGQLAKKVLPAYGLNPAELNTVALLKDGVLYTQSTALLQVLKALGGGWRLLYFLGSIIPAPLRNGLYNWVARKRYDWFGKRDKCLLPRPEWKARFLD